MKKIATDFEGLFVIEPRVFGDERGYFFESYNEAAFAKLDLPTHYAQDNCSRSAQGVLRGLHYQKEPQAQAKLVRVTRGKVWDCVVDIRPGSKTFGRYFGIELSEENKQMLFVPEGFAHGFCVLSEVADFVYKCTRLYSPPDEKGLMWNDPDLNIPWPVKNPIVSAKDQVLGRLCDLR